MLPEHYPLSYGLSVGNYLIYNPLNRSNGGAAFAPNYLSRLSGIVDGLSNTLAMSEVKAFTPRIQDSVLPPVPPTSREMVSSIVSGGDWSAMNGHTEWVCGRAIHSGFTTTFPPNTIVPRAVDGVIYDVDVCSSREGRDQVSPTYGVITSRSYHTGMVSCLLMDGSVHSISSSIEAFAWQSLGTRGGFEIKTEF